MEPSDDPKKIAERIAELQATQLLVCAQLRALMFLSAKIWRQMNIQMPDDKPFEQVLQTMAEEQKEYMLSFYADHDPDTASYFKRLIEKMIKGQDPFK